jgi:hypothetical protein
VAALAGAASVAALPLVRTSEDILQAVGFRVAALALLALVAALVLEWPSLVPFSLVLVGGLYGAELAVDDAGLDTAAPLIAAALVVTADLAYWSLEEREGVRAEPGDGLRRLAFVALVALSALLIGAMMLVLVDGVQTGSLAVDVLGAAAAAAALVAVVALARREA